MEPFSSFLAIMTIDTSLTVTWMDGSLIKSEHTESMNGFCSVTDNRLSSPPIASEVQIRVKRQATIHN